MKRRWLGFALFIAAALTVGWLIADRLSLSTIADREQSVRDWIAEHPLTSWVLGFFIYLFVSLVPGTRGKAVAGGWLFGFWPGLLLVNGALTLAAVIGFSISRFFLRDSISEHYSLRLRGVNLALEKKGAFYVILLRVVPVSYTLTNYVLGATNVKPRTYVWATQLGLLPGNIVFVNAGAQLPSLHEIVHQGWGVLLTWNVVGGLILLSSFALLAPLIVQYWSQRSESRGHSVAV